MSLYVATAIGSYTVAGGEMFKITGSRLAMDCPKCGEDKIAATKSMRPMRDATYYSMECGDCGHKWRAMRGWRRRAAGDGVDWSNVDFIPSKRDIKRREDSAKVEKCECPHCGGKLATVEEDAGRLVDYVTTCDGCCFKVTGNRIKHGSK